MVGQHQPVPIRRDAEQRHPKHRLIGAQIADRGAFGGAHPLDPFLTVGVLAVHLDIAPPGLRIGRDDLHRLVESLAETGHQVRMAGDHRLHRLAQPGRVQRAGHGESQLHRIHLVVTAARGAGMKEQPLLQRGQRQNIGDPVVALQLVDLWLAEPGRGDIRRRQPTPTGAHVRADAGQGLKPQPANPDDRRVIERRACPHPVGVQLRAGLGVHGDGVKFHGVRQRHRQRRGHAGHRHAFWGDSPRVASELARRPAEAPQIVEPDHRVRSAHLHIGVQIAQQPVAQGIGQRPKLLFGVLDQRPQPRIAGEHLRPGQPAYRQGHRV
ncbi:hypothetical protein LAUMK13_03010 [Mycobacterium innocens]|uniref:Uncharacterized protein n=1 Tax=Mycobacterium innocens TaxID=2341083 RepID=A0A498Q2J1_9MYCO|nr:hypothetical protein LAUMK13_03010 [Mycobacterium innocens]